MKNWRSRNVRYTLAIAGTITAAYVSTQPTLATMTKSGISVT